MFVRDQPVNRLSFTMLPLIAVLALSPQMSPRQAEHLIKTVLVRCGETAPITLRPNFFGTAPILSSYRVTDGISHRFIVVVDRQLGAIASVGEEDLNVAEGKLRNRKWPAHLNAFIVLKALGVKGFVLEAGIPKSDGTIRYPFHQEATHTLRRLTGALTLESGTGRLVHFRRGVRMSSEGEGPQRTSRVTSDQATAIALRALDSENAMIPRTPDTTVKISADSAPVLTESQGVKVWSVQVVVTVSNKSGRRSNTRSVLVNADTGEVIGRQVTYSHAR